MSTIVIRYKEELTDIIQSHKQEIDAALIKTTAETFNIDPKNVILDYTPFTEMSVQTPDILLRGETSTKRQSIIKPWADALLATMKELQLSNTLRIAVKTYCIDSVWTE